MESWRFADADRQIHAFQIAETTNTTGRLLTAPVYGDSTQRT